MLKSFISQLKNTNNHEDEYKDINKWIHMIKPKNQNKNHKIKKNDEKFF